MKTVSFKTPVDQVSLHDVDPSIPIFAVNKKTGNVEGLVAESMSGDWSVRLGGGTHANGFHPSRRRAMEAASDWFDFVVDIRPA